MATYSKVSTTLQGLVIKSRDYKESSIVLTIITQDGLIDLIVNGIKKPSSRLINLVQQFSLVNLVVSVGKVFKTVTDGEVLESFMGIKEDTYKQLIALSIIEYVDVFKDSITDYSSCYDFILNIFKILNNCDNEVTLCILPLFELKFLYLLGIQPTFNNCVKCGKPGLYFSVEDGGVLCSKHKTISCFNESITRLIHLIYHVKLNNVNDEFLKIIKEYFQDINKAIDLYYDYYFDYYNKNKKLYFKLLN